MNLRRIVRIGGWGPIVALSLVGLIPLWQAFGWPIRHGALTADTIMWTLLQGLLPLTVLTFLSFAVGGACILVADIHERLQKET